MTDHLLHEPHHDGSPMYADTERPALGGTVRLRATMLGHSAAERSVVDRLFQNPEPTDAR